MLTERRRDPCVRILLEKRMTKKALRDLEDNLMDEQVERKNIWGEILFAKSRKQCIYQ